MKAAILFPFSSQATASDSKVFSPKSGVNPKNIPMAEPSAIEETLMEVEKRFTDIKPGEPVDFSNENGVKFLERDFTAKDKGSARALAIVAFTVDKESYFALFQAGTPEADKEYTQDVVAIVKSITPLMKQRDDAAARGQVGQCIFDGLPRPS